MTPDALLRTGLEALELSVSAAAQQRLMAYVALIDKWNKVHNLTAIRDVAAMVPHHLLDSLAVVPYVGDGPLLDVGSGAGLPGIPIALVRPEVAVVLLDSNHKKSAFLRQALIELGIRNASVVTERVETYQPPRGFDTVVSRAFAELSQFARLAGRHVAPGGRMLAMKGVFPNEEMAQLDSGFEVRRVVRLTVPGLNAMRHLVVLERP